MSKVKAEADRLAERRRQYRLEKRREKYRLAVQLKADRLAERRKAYAEGGALAGRHHLAAPAPAAAAPLVWQGNKWGPPAAQKK